GPERTTIEITDQGRTAEPPSTGREMAALRGVNPPVPGTVRYRETGDMPDPPPAQRGNRPIAAQNGVPPPPPPRPAPPARRMLADVRPSANLPRAPSGPGQADTANGSPRPPNGSFDSRSKPKVVEGPRVIEAPRVAEGSSPEAAPSSVKLLPSSCWSGSASRWQWWASSQGSPCK